MVTNNKRGSDGKLIDVPISNWLNVTDKGVTNTQRNSNLSKEKSDKRTISKISGAIENQINPRTINNWFNKRNNMLKAYTAIALFLSVINIVIGFI